eukprot:1159310-Pelagomonas_calceolata.AAC.1
MHDSLTGCCLRNGEASRTEESRVPLYACDSCILRSLIVVCSTGREAARQAKNMRRQAERKAAHERRLKEHAERKAAEAAAREEKKAQ